MKIRKWVCLLIALLLVAAMLPQHSASASAAEQTTLTFSDTGVAETVHVPGCSVSGTVP